MADMTIEDAAKEDWDLVVLPGGMPGRNNFNLGNHKKFGIVKGEIDAPFYFAAAAYLRTNLICYFAHQSLKLQARTTCEIPRL
jgi:hypothetical protein